MWMVLRRLGCPEHFVGLVRALHEGMSGRVFHDSRLSEEFPVTSGLKQGCVLAPTLFFLYLAAMLHDIPPDNPGVNIRYRLDGAIFNTSRLRSRRHSCTRSITELQYADDNAAPCHSTNALQQSVNNFSSAYSRFGLTVNVKKTKVLAQPAPKTSLPVFNISIGEAHLEQVDHFPYLGSILSSNCTAEKDVDHRIGAAHSAFG